MPNIPVTTGRNASSMTAWAAGAVQVRVGMARVQEAVDLVVRGVTRIVLKAAARAPAALADRVGMVIADLGLAVKAALDGMIAADPVVMTVLTDQPRNRCRNFRSH